MNSFNDILKKNDNAAAAVRSILNIKNKDPEFELQNILPDSITHKDLLSKVFKAFKQETDIPCSLPVFALFSYISAYLLKNEVNIHIPGIKKPLLPDLWIINLANSGSSKTFSKSVIENLIPNDVNNEPLVKANFEQPASAAAFVVDLQEKNNGFYFQDECAQLIKQLENLGSPLAEMKKYLLMSYDHQRVSRKTKKDEIIIEKPSLSIYWLNTIDSFVKNISPESIYDGFCQRFMYVISMSDVDRPFEYYAFYYSEKISKFLEKDFNAFFNLQLHKSYHVNEEAAQCYEYSFKDFVSVYFDGKVDASFYRRVMFNSFKYALIYHLILGKENNEIDLEDMKFALKVCLIHLFSLKKLLTYKESGYSPEVEKLEKIKSRVKQLYEESKKKGEPLTIRKLMRSVLAIKTKEEAIKYLEILGLKLDEAPAKKLTKFEKSESPATAKPVFDLNESLSMVITEQEEPWLKDDPAIWQS